MTDTQRNPLSAAAVRSLLTTAARLRQQGDVQRARVILRALAAQRPDDPRVWRALADVAESEEERRNALRRVVLLVRAARASPQTHPLPGPSAAAPPVTPPPLTPPMPSPGSLPSSPAAAPATSPPAPPPPPADTAPSHATSPSLPSAQVDQAPAAPVAGTTPPALNLTRYTWVGIAITGVALLIFAGLLANARFPATGVRPEPTPPLATLEPTGEAASAAPSPGVPTASPVVAVETPLAPSPTTVAPTSAPLPPTVPPPPTLTPAPTLPPGTVILRDVWTLTLLRPDHVVVLNGSIGARQPNGRFILALVAVGNGGVTAAVAPATLFALVDQRGNRYLPEPALSTLYLETFGRGRYGDFSLDEAIPAGVGQVSIPVIFEVPMDARGLSLHLGESVAGWTVQGLP
ncbi:MAG: tetratricopeptide repeat protein [Roseiflexus sp.]